MEDVYKKIILIKFFLKEKTFNSQLLALHSFLDPRSFNKVDSEVGSTLNFSSGQSLIEILLAIALAAILLPALLTGFIASREGKAQAKQRLQAITLMKESQEAVRNVREKGWATFAVNGTYHPLISGSTWNLVSGPDTVNSFTRQIVISDVSRDNNGTIVTSGGTVDPSTKKVITTVSWNTPFPSSTSSTTYLTRYLENDAYTETTDTQFNLGVKTGVAVTGTGNAGQVILGAGGQGSWCAPDLTETQIDLPKNGVANAISAIEVAGTGVIVSAGTGDNASGVSLANITLTNSNPPSEASRKTFDGYKTNGIFSDGRYVYIATDNNSKEVIIVDTSLTPPQEVGYFNAPGNTTGTSVYVSGTTGYVIVGNHLYSFNLTSKTGSRPILDSDGVHLTATGYKVVIVGSYAYVATGGSTRDFIMINVTNPSNMTLVGGTITNAAVARDITVNSTGTRAYLVTDSSSAYEQNEFFIINTSNKASSTFPVVGTFNAGYLDVKGVAVVPGNRVILVGSEYSGQEVDEYQVLSVANESAPILCGSSNVESPIRGVAAVLESDGDAYSYIIVGMNPELRVIKGGPGGSFATSGTFESKIFDLYPLTQTAFNRFFATVSTPASTTMKIQIAIAKPTNTTSTGCTAATYSYVGPLGSSSSFYTPVGSTISGVLAFDNDGIGYENPGRCFRYKVYLDTPDSNSTPTFDDITVNYSP